MELNFDALMRIAKDENEFRPISKYPAIMRDISILVPKTTKAVEIMDKIENTAGELLIDTDLFDIYQEKEREQKSLAFRLTFQSHDKTLSDAEVNEIMEDIMKTLEETKEWEVRK